MGKDFCEPFNSGQECFILFTHENNKKYKAKFAPGRLLFYSFKTAFALNPDLSFICY